VRSFILYFALVNFRLGRFRCRKERGYARSRSFRELRGVNNRDVVVRMNNCYVLTILRSNDLSTIQEDANDIQNGRE